MNAFVIFVIGPVIICCLLMTACGQYAVRVMIPSLEVKKNELYELWDVVASVKYVFV